MPPTPPVAARRPTVLRAHGHERIDDWHWLRERDNPEVIAYLEEENAYTEAVTQHTEALRKVLFDEIVGRIQETDLSVPYRRGEYWYYSRTVEGLQYPIYCRKHGSLDSPEQVMLDENELAAGHDFFALGALSVSPDHRLLAYSTDPDGDEVYTLRVRDLATGEDLPDEIPGTYYGVEWAMDNATLFYTVLNDAKRPWRLYRHALGTGAPDDVVVHQEDDEAFFVSVHRTKSDAFLLLNLHSMVTSEVRYLAAGDPDGAFTVLYPRRQGVEYDVDHHGDEFLVVTNDEAENFRLVAVPVAEPRIENGREVVPHRADVKLDSVDVFAGHFVFYERAQGLRRIRVMDLSADDVHTIEQPEPVYTASPGTNVEFESRVLRFGYTSLVTPPSVFDYDMDARTRELMKQQPVLGGYDPVQYRSQRLWATAPDGVRVPVSLVAHVDTPQDGTAPLLLYGYGSYETSRDPTFSSLRLSLLDRGVVFAIAHVRGGGEMGRRWYEDGKLLRKRNTFTDFIACAEHLVAERYTSSDRLVIMGGSAGGLLVGAATNMRPDLFRAVVAEVPFVDCVTTILDETLPLTVIEWEEWGDPRDPEVYEYMLSYSPYDNVEAKDYPWMLVTAGLNDPRVSYWEPAKWVAKLRATKTDSNPLLLKTEMGAGHMGPSGRYDAWKHDAFIYAFVLDAVGITS